MRLTDYMRGVGQPIAYYPTLHGLTGSVTATLMLCQHIYWAGKGDDPGGWIYKTGVEWQAELGLSRTELESARKVLRERGYVDEIKRGVPARIWYRLNAEAVNAAWDALQTSLQESCKLDCGNPANKVAGIPQTITEITPETTQGSMPSIPIDATLEERQDMRLYEARIRRERLARSRQGIADT